jgi:hypothetical protein
MYNEKSTRAGKQLPPKKDKKAYSNKYSAVYARNWRKENPEACSSTGCKRPKVLSKSLCEYHRVMFYKRHVKALRERKIRVLSHYSPKGKLRCSWRGCHIVDLDMLSIDHLNNNGAEERKSGYEGCGSGLYARLEREGYPKGFQTLCHNHQWKKEAIRRRKEFEERNCGSAGFRNAGLYGAIHIASTPSMRSRWREHQ